MRPRTKLLIPKVPGGFLDGPPEGCPNVVAYCPDPKRYEAILIVDYVRCSRSHCSLPSICQRRLEADRGRRHRISVQRNGEYAHQDQ